MRCPRRPAADSKQAPPVEHRPSDVAAWRRRSVESPFGHTPEDAARPRVDGQSPASVHQSAQKKQRRPRARTRVGRRGPPLLIFLSYPGHLLARMTNHLTRRSSSLRANGKRRVRSVPYCFFKPWNGSSGPISSTVNTCRAIFQHGSVVRRIK